MHANRSECNPFLELCTHWKPPLKKEYFGNRVSAFTEMTGDEKNKQQHMNDL